MRINLPWRGISYVLFIALTALAFGAKWALVPAGVWVFIEMFSL